MKKINNENCCKCKKPKWSEIIEKPLTAGSLSTSDTRLLVYQICQKCKFARVLAN